MRWNTAGGGAGNLRRRRFEGGNWARRGFGLQGRLGVKPLSGSLLFLLFGGLGRIEMELLLKRRLQVFELRVSQPAAVGEIDVGRRDRGHSDIGIDL